MHFSSLTRDNSSGKASLLPPSLVPSMMLLERFTEHLENTCFSWRTYAVPWCRRWLISNLFCFSSLSLRGRSNRPGGGVSQIIRQMRTEIARFKTGTFRKDWWIVARLCIRGIIDAIKESSFRVLLFKGGAATALAVIWFAFVTHVNRWKRKVEVTWRYFLERRIMGCYLCYGWIEIISGCFL